MPPLVQSPGEEAAKSQTSLLLQGGIAIVKAQPAFAGSIAEMIRAALGGRSASGEVAPADGVTPKALLLPLLDAMKLDPQVSGVGGSPSLNDTTCTPT